MEREYERSEPRTFSEEELENLILRIVERAARQDHERIADIAAQKALDKVYVDVGKGVLKRATWLLGAGLVAVLIWAGQNHIKLF